MFSNSFSPAKRSGGGPFPATAAEINAVPKFMSTGCWFLTCFTVIPIINHTYIHIYIYIQSWFSIDVDSWDRLNPNRGTKGTCAWSVLDGLYFRATGSPDTCHGRDFAKDASCSTCPTGAAATSLATGHHGPCDHGTRDHGTRDHGTPDHGTGIWTTPTHTVWANPAARSLACGVMERGVLVGSDASEIVHDHPIIILIQHARICRSYIYVDKITAWDDQEPISINFPK